VLKLPPTTAWRRIEKIRRTGELGHGNKGRQNRRPIPDRDRILAAAAKYTDFGISHVCELLEARDGIKVNRETLRRWLGRKRSRKVPKQRQRRECSPCFGDLLQIDGSFERWFGEERCCMMNIVDDATNMAQLRFDAQETVEAACRCAWRWLKEYGAPRAFYADGRNMYHLDPDTQDNFFTAMCRNLGIRVILARSPQAKGRVERWNGVHQRRLIPLMRLDGVRDMESANRYLEGYLVGHNRRYARPPREGDSHRALPDWARDIDDVCFIETARELKNDWTFQYDGKTYQIPRQSSYPPAKSKIRLKISLSGRITASYRRSVSIVQ
jgi:transposase-like protein